MKCSLATASEINRTRVIRNIHVIVKAGLF